jgi:hypothetical protein
MKGFQMDLDTAMEFYRRCHEMGLKDEASRMALMSQMIHEENIKILDEKGLAKMLSGKKIVRIKPGGPR